MQPKDAKRWGTDFGNVIVKNWTEDSKHVFLSTNHLLKHEEIDDFLRGCSHLLENAISSLRTLVSRVGAENVWVVSRCNEVEEVINRRIMRVLDVFCRTGIPVTHMHCVLLRHEKAGVCARFGIEGFVDDRGEVLSALVGVVPCLIWLDPSEEDERLWGDKLRGKVIIARSWEEIMKFVCVA